MLKSDQLQSKSISPDLFPLTWAALEAGLKDEVSPGFVVGIWQKKKPNEILLAAHGDRRRFPASLPSLPMTPETVFDLASVTKVFGTAVLAAVLVDRGWLDWDTPVSAFFPEYPHHEILVRHLLSHTGGLIAWKPLWEDLKHAFSPRALEAVSVIQRQELMRKLVFSISPETEPEKQTVYSDLSFLILGFILEELTHLPLDQAVQKWVWQPMGITGAYYHRVELPSQKDLHLEVAATEDSVWRGGILQGQVHDDNCWAMGGYAGHAGAFAKARDVLHFARALFHGFLTPATLKAMWTRVPQPPGCDRTLGWDTPSGDAPAASFQFSSDSVGHLGFTGTSLWIDPQAELAATVLTNRVHPSRENIKIRAWRFQIHEALRLDFDRFCKSNLDKRE